jgi:LmbE family N-acetylglucosaminyl deacetylase
MPPFQRAAYYVVAHQDDWQLFMTPNAYRDLSDQGCKVVFIYLTAGDAGNEANYWSAREKSALESLRAVLDTTTSAPGDITLDQPALNGHRIQHASYKNTESFSLRLPDGKLKGTGSDRYHMQSLTKFLAGTIPTMTTVDESTTYSSWDDLMETITQIVQATVNGISEFWMNSTDYWLVLDQISNADHVATGHAVEAVIARLKQHAPLTLFRDYETGIFPVNVGAHRLAWKMRIYEAYDASMQVSIHHCTLCENAYYAEWPLRQYQRQRHTNPIVDFLGAVWIAFLRIFIALEVLKLILQGKPLTVPDKGH